MGNQKAPLKQTKSVTTPTRESKSDPSEVLVDLRAQKKKESAAPSETLTRQTLRRLTGWLKDGTFAPGSRLPSQGALVKRLGVSRTGVREALQAMAALDLIEIHPGLGCFVKRTGPNHLINEDVLAITLEKEAILDVVETRRILEAGIAPLAAQRATERDFWNIEDALSLIEKAVRRKESVAEIGPAFHNAVAEATHNTILAKLLRSFNILMARAGKLLEAEALDAEEFKLLELESHRKLYNVIRTRDPIAARETFIQHISNSEDLIIKAFRRAEADQHDEDAKKSERPRVRR